MVCVMFEPDLLIHFSFPQIPSSPISAVSVEHADHLTDEEEATKTKTQIGVPNVILQCMNTKQSMHQAVFNENIFPSFNQVNISEIIMLSVLDAYSHSIGSEGKLADSYQVIYKRVNAQNIVKTIYIQSFAAMKTHLAKVVELPPKLKFLVSTFHHFNTM